MDTYQITKNQAKTFEIILRNGKPKSLYQLSDDLKIANAARHIEDMEKENEIMIYEQEESGRRTTFYGPTVIGFIQFYSASETLRNDIENFFRLWLDHEKFRADLIKYHFPKDSFDKEPEKCAEVFKDFVFYHNAIEEAYYHFIDRDPDDVPQSIKEVIGGIELGKNPEFLKALESVVTYLPGMKEELINHLKAVNKQNENIIRNLESL